MGMISSTVLPESLRRADASRIPVVGTPAGGLGPSYPLVGPVLEVTAYGTPIGQGQLSYKGKNRKTGKALMLHSNAKRLTPWRDEIAARAADALEALPRAERALFPLSGPVAAYIVLTMPPPKAKADRDRPYPTVNSSLNSDTDHLIRAIGDALTNKNGLPGTRVWVDDALLIEPHVVKTYPAGRPYSHPLALAEPGVRIQLYLIGKPARSAEVEPVPDVVTPTGLDREGASWPAGDRPLCD